MQWNKFTRVVFKSKEQEDAVVQGAYSRKIPETGITTCYYYFDYYLLLHLLLLITTYIASYITSHYYSAITICYF